MIDWSNLIMNAFWILGCATALATLSYASWDASTSEEGFFVHIKQPQYQTFLNLGGLLFCVGLAGTSNVIWQQVLWGLLGLGFVYQIVMEIRVSRGKVSD